MLNYSNNMPHNSTSDRQTDRQRYRTWLSALIEQFLQMTPEEFNSVDEIMIPFNGNSRLHRSRVGSSGILYD